MFFATSKSGKKAFTLFELLLVVFIVGVGIAGLIATISYGKSFAEKTRKQVIATNIAREGIETIYSIRDTNYQRWGVKKDACWLKADPLVGDEDCQNGVWLREGNYIVSTGTLDGGANIYQRLVNVGANELSIKDGINAQDKEYTVCRTTNGYWYNCQGQEPNYIKEGRFFRQIKGIGLYDKVTGAKLNCNDGNACGNSDLKEYRFCSRVEYMGEGDGKVELCGVMLNFLDK